MQGRVPGRLAALALGAPLGGLAVGGFAPFSIAPLLLAPGLLLWLLARWPQRAAWASYGYGLGYFGLGTFWVWHSLHHFGNFPPLVAGLGTALFCGGLALFFVPMGLLFRGAAASLSGHPRAVPILWLLVFPALFSLEEWMQANLFTGLPWLELGVGAVSTPMAGWIPLLGAPLTGWLLCLTAAALALALLPRGGDGWRAGAGIRLALLVLAALPWATGQGLRQLSWTSPSGPPVQIAAVSTDMDLREKWGPDGVSLSLERLVAHTPAQAPLVLWPEAALPLALRLEQPPPFLHRLRELYDKLGQTVVGGFIRWDAQNRPHNAMALLSGGTAHYDKERLVPFGEYTPYEAVLESFAWFTVPYSRLTAGRAGQGAMDSPVGGLAPAICYEVAFRDEFLRRARGADFLLNHANAAWFGSDQAAEQMLQMARVRALEAGRWMLYAVNGGDAAVISPQGAIVQRARGGAAVARAQARQGRPPAFWLPEWLALLPLALAVWVAWRALDYTGAPEAGGIGSRG